MQHKEMPRPKRTYTIKRNRNNKNLETQTHA